jgi:circadian clock protein KaiC
MQDPDYAATGIPGLDRLLEGKGIPRGYGVFVVGGPGSGKTTLSLQFLCTGASQSEEPGVYICFDEHLNNVRRHAVRFGWDLARLERDKLLQLVDASPMRFIKADVKVGQFAIGKGEFTIASLVEEARRLVGATNAKRLVFDPLALLLSQYHNEMDRRNAILDLMVGISGLGVTTLYVSELAQSALDRAYQLEEYMAQGVFVLRKLLRPGGVLRMFTVEKMRSVDHDAQPHPYHISHAGVEVYPSEIAL